VGAAGVVPCMNNSKTRVCLIGCLVMAERPHGLMLSLPLQE
jgi:hypothetical protein